MQKTVLITGGSKGIGLATGLFLAEQGFRVFGTSRTPEKIENHPFELLPLDVTDGDSIKRCLELLSTKSNRLDVLDKQRGCWHYRTC